MAVAGRVGYSVFVVAAAAYYDLHDAAFAEAKVGSEGEKLKETYFGWKDYGRTCVRMEMEEALGGCCHNERADVVLLGEYPECHPST